MKFECRFLKRMVWGISFDIWLCLNVVTVSIETLGNLFIFIDSKRITKIIMKMTHFNISSHMTHQMERL